MSQGHQVRSRLENTAQEACHSFDVHWPAFRLLPTWWALFRFKKRRPYIKREREREIIGGLFDSLYKEVDWLTQSRARDLQRLKGVRPCQTPSIPLPLPLQRNADSLKEGLAFLPPAARAKVLSPVSWPDL